MAQFTIKIAGHTAAVTSLFDSTRDYCRSYLTEEPPEYTIAVTRQDLDFEQAFLAEEARQEGLRLRTFPDPFLDRAAVQRKMAECLAEQNVLLFHGSLVALDGEGYLFAAKCGTGKSTHTRLWRQVFGARAVMVNDDKPFLTVTKDGILASGAPWSGKHGLDANVTVPLTAICILERGRENRIRPATSEEAAAVVREQACPPLLEENQEKFHSLAETLVEKGRFFHMTCTKDPEAAVVAQEAMTETHSVRGNDRNPNW